MSTVKRGTVLRVETLTAHDLNTSVKELLDGLRSSLFGVARNCQTVSYELS